MKTIAQLLIAGLVVHACVRAGASAWRYYEFKDAVTQEARYGAKSTLPQLHSRILELAQERDIPLGYDDIAVEREGEQTYVWAAYYEPIPLVPAVYTREHLFELAVTVRVVRPVTAEDLK